MNDPRTTRTNQQSYEALESILLEGHYIDETEVGDKIIWLVKNQNGGEPVGGRVYLNHLVKAYRAYLAMKAQYGIKTL